MWLRGITSDIPVVRKRSWQTLSASFCLTGDLPCNFWLLVKAFHIFKVSKTVASAISRCLFRTYVSALFKTINLGREKSISIRLYSLQINQNLNPEVLGILV